MKKFVKFFSVAFIVLALSVGTIFIVLNPPDESEGHRSASVVGASEVQGF